MLRDLINTIATEFPREVHELWAELNFMDGPLDWSWQVWAIGGFLLVILGALTGR